MGGAVRSTHASIGPRAYLGECRLRRSRATCAVLCAGAPQGRRARRSGIPAPTAIWDRRRSRRNPPRWVPIAIWAVQAVMKMPQPVLLRLRPRTRGPQNPIVSCTHGGRSCATTLLFLRALRRFCCGAGWHPAADWQSAKCRELPTLFVCGAPRAASDSTDSPAAAIK
jgi:hypothetical protein